ncbi:MAG: 4-hydroxy-tetrahydrodipicolinate reductase [Candidatus Velthaea sp.]
MGAPALRVGVAGAHGRLGRIACSAIAAADDMELTAGFVRDASDAADTLPLYDELGAFYGAGLDVVVDCTVYPVSLDVVREAIDAGVAPVIGATGWTDEDLVSLADRCDEAGIGALLVPNFSVGAVLMMRFAAQAAKLMPHVEIVELHHDGKRDRPSGTAVLTARRIADAGGPAEVPIHSVRLPGLVAHQETIFGGTGETLTIRHDSLSRESFAPGILLAVRNAREQRGLISGLDTLLFPKEPE